MGPGPRGLDRTVLGSAGHAGAALPRGADVSSVPRAGGAPVERAAQERHLRRRQRPQRAGGRGSDRATSRGGRHRLRRHGPVRHRRRPGDRDRLLDPRSRRPLGRCGRDGGGILDRPPALRPRAGGPPPAGLRPIGGQRRQLGRTAVGGSGQRLPVRQRGARVAAPRKALHHPPPARHLSAAGGRRGRTVSGHGASGPLDRTASARIRPRHRHRGRGAAAPGGPVDRK